MSNPQQRHPWDGFVSEQDILICSEAGFGALQGFGSRPCILVVDATIGMVGKQRLPIRQSIRECPDSCGESGWRALEHIDALLRAGRLAGIPIIYIQPMDREAPRTSAAESFSKYVGKYARWGEASRYGEATEIAPMVAPHPGDYILQKPRASAFFGTHLGSLLISMGVDWLIVCGSSTSGCVRATVNDGAAFNFKITIPEECVFDRSETSHAVNLFDMHLKSADVLPLERVIERIAMP